MVKKIILLMLTLAALAVYPSHTQAQVANVGIERMTQESQIVVIGKVREIWILTDEEKLRRFQTFDAIIGMVAELEIEELLLTADSKIIEKHAVKRSGAALAVKIVIEEPLGRSESAGLLEDKRYLIFLRLRSINPDQYPHHSLYFPGTRMKKRKDFPEPDVSYFSMVRPPHGHILVDETTRWKVEEIRSYLREKSKRQ